MNAYWKRIREPLVIALMAVILVTLAIVSQQPPAVVMGAEGTGTPERLYGYGFGVKDWACEPSLDPSNLNSAWWYDWRDEWAAQTATPAAGWNDPDYVPMFFSGDWWDAMSTEQKDNWCTTKESRDRTWMLFNEQCFYDGDGCADRYFELWQYCEAWRNDVVVGLGRIDWLPGSCNASGVVQEFGQQLATLEAAVTQTPLPDGHTHRDPMGVHVHMYSPDHPLTATPNWDAAQACAEAVGTAIAEYLPNSEEIWLTEVGDYTTAWASTPTPLAAWREEYRDGFMIPLVAEFLPDLSAAGVHVDRAAWFSAATRIDGYGACMPTPAVGVTDLLEMGSGGDLTALGDLWNILTPDETLLPDADTWISSADPDTTHEGTLFAWVYEDNSYVAMMDFDLPDRWMGYQIEEAILHVRISEYGGYEMPLKAHRLLVDWEDDEAIWEERLTSTDWTGIGCSSQGDDFAGASDTVTVSSTGWYELDVTGMVQKWFDGTGGQFGVLLRSDGTGLGYLKLRSLETGIPEYRPYLSLTFTNFTP